MAKLFQMNLTAQSNQGGKSCFNYKPQCIGKATAHSLATQDLMAPACEMPQSQPEATASPGPAQMVKEVCDASCNLRARG